MSTYLNSEFTSPILVVDVKDLNLHAYTNKENLKEGPFCVATVLVLDAPKEVSAFDEKAPFYTISSIQYEGEMTTKKLIKFADTRDVKRNTWSGGAKQFIVVHGENMIEQGSGNYIKKPGVPDPSFSYSKKLYDVVNSYALKFIGIELIKGDL